MYAIAYVGQAVNVASEAWTWPVLEHKRPPVFHYVLPNLVRWHSLILPTLFQVAMFV